MDTFHEGEYVGFVWHMREYYAGTTSFPLLVHGGMDYLPSLLVWHLFGPESLIFGTRVLNMVLVALGSLLFLDSCRLLMGQEFGLSRFWPLLLLATFYYFSAPLNSTSLYVSGGFLGVRETFLLLTVWCLTRSGFQRGKGVARTFLAAGSGAAVVSVFWCYDRGIATAVFAVVFLLGALWRKKFLDALLMILSALVAAAVLHQLKIFGSLPENLSNILYWIGNAGDINPYPFELSYLPGYFGLLVLSGFACCIIFAALRERLGRDHGSPMAPAIVVGLILVQLVIIKLISGRADIDRSFNGGWPSLVLMLHFGSQWLSSPQLTLPALRKEVPRRFLAAASVSLLCYLAFSSTAFFNYARLLKNIGVPPKDTALVDPELAVVGALLQQYGGRCYYGWTNDGVVALMSKKPFCTDFPYAHYASSTMEGGMLAQLKKEDPPAILFDSTTWAMSIDGRSMSARFPRVSQYILNEYPRRAWVGAYRLALR